MNIFKRSRKPNKPTMLDRAIDANYWLPFQILAMNFGMKQEGWERVKPELARVEATGSPVADFVLAARIAGVEFTAPSDWGMEPWDVRAAREEGSDD